MIRRPGQTPKKLMSPGMPRGRAMGAEQFDRRIRRGKPGNDIQNKIIPQCICNCSFVLCRIDILGSILAYYSHGKRSLTFLTYKVEYIIDNNDVT